MNHSASQWLPYGLILLGLALAFLAAVVPHYDAGYYLMTGVLLAGLLPYLVYALAAALMRGPLVLVAGLLLVLLHGVLVVQERLTGSPGPGGDLLFYGPLLLAALCLPLLWRALREPWR
jgi:hypothetical protein